MNGLPSRAQQPKGFKQDKDRDTALRALDNALRDALATVARDDVMQRVATVLTEEVGGDQGPQNVAAAARQQVRHDLLGDLLDELEAEHGPVPEEVREQTRRMWPNFEEDE